MSQKETAVFIGSHFEEIEGSCPILPCKLAAKGMRVIFLNPIGGWNWFVYRNMKPGAIDRTRRHAMEAATCLGCEKILWDYPCADVPTHRREIAVRMAEALAEINPSLVFVHWPYDSHPDHRIIAQISFDVLHVGINLSEKVKVAGISAKEVYAFQAATNQTYDFWPDFLVLATKEEIKKSQRSLAHYKDFKGKKRSFWWGDIMTKLNYWKGYAGKPAEPYKFLGPRLPLHGLRLAEILGKDILPLPVNNECWQFGKDFFHLTA